MARWWRTPAPRRGSVARWRSDRPAKVRSYCTDQDATGFEHRAPTTPERAAEIIIRGMRSNRKRTIVGSDARLLMIAGRLFPMATLHLATREWRQTQRRR